MKLHEILNESVEDIGIFKAVFFGGLPGAGKSYVLSKISAGHIQPRIVNTDKLYMFGAHKRKIDISSDSNSSEKSQLVDTASHLNVRQLYNYLNGMLPLFIDGTSSNPSAVLRRAGILESLGYDVGMVWVDVNVEAALHRASQRNRHVDPDYIRAVNDDAEANKKYYTGKFKMFTSIDNNEGQLTDNVILQAYKKVTNFFESGISNPIGNRTVARLHDRSEKYLTPTVMHESELRSIVSQWYVR
jgi:cytidylate kinase